MTDLVTIFCEIDDFCKQFNAQMKIGEKKKGRTASLEMSEIMTISILYHESGYTTFKDYYTKLVQAPLSLIVLNLKHAM